jgi:hypothetical protein
MRSFAGQMWSVATGVSSIASLLAESIAEVIHNPNLDLACPLWMLTMLIAELSGSIVTQASTYPVGANFGSDSDGRLCELPSSAVRTLGSRGLSGSEDAQEMLN